MLGASPEPPPHMSDGMRGFSHNWNAGGSSNYGSRSQSNYDQIRNAALAAALRGLKKF
jgi:hypothetical protein